MAKGERSCFSNSRIGVILIALAGAALVYVALEHRARLLELMPYLVVLACPLIHLFGHGGHGANRQDGPHGARQARNEPVQPALAGMKDGHE